MFLKIKISRKKMIFQKKILSKKMTSIASNKFSKIVVSSLVPYMDNPKGQEE